MKTIESEMITSDFDDTIGGTMDGNDLDKHSESEAIEKDITQDQSLEDIEKGDKRKRKKSKPEKVFSTIER